MTRLKWWTGSLPVHLLTDGVIECGDYPDWQFARRAITTLAYDRDILDRLLADIPVNGIEEPLTIGVWRRDLTMYLSDGHHRAIALKTLKIKTFPYRWSWKSHGEPIRFEREPMPDWILEGNVTL